MIDFKYKIERTSRFKKDYKRIKKRGYDISLLAEVLTLLAQGEPLPEKYQDHPLKGQYKGCRECHITSDWLLIYEISNETLYLYLTRTGTHADLKLTE
jgi:mRNA interferase YafQ